MLFLKALKKNFPFLFLVSSGGLQFLAFLGSITPLSALIITWSFSCAPLLYLCDGKRGKKDLKGKDSHPPLLALKMQEADQKPRNAGDLHKLGLSVS